MRTIDADSLMPLFMEKANTTDKHGVKFGENWLLDYEDIKDVIDNAPTVNTTCPNCDSGYAQGYSDGYLKGKEDRPQGEWIPVSERLPDKEGEYLVTRADFDNWGVCRVSNVIDIAKFDYSSHYNNGFHKAYEVIAWMPLPEPYKEAENECKNDT